MFLVRVHILQRIAGSTLTRAMSAIVASIRSMLTSGQERRSSSPQPPPVQPLPQSPPPPPPLPQELPPRILWWRRSKVKKNLRKAARAEKEAKKEQVRAARRQQLRNVEAGTERLFKRTETILWDMSTAQRELFEYHKALVSIKTVLARYILSRHELRPVDEVRVLDKSLAAEIKQCVKDKRYGDRVRMNENEDQAGGRLPPSVDA